MKKDAVNDSAVEDKDGSFDIDSETVKDIMERINGLSYDGQREIIAYLKTQIAKKGK
ncbi:hypothetical protein ACFL1N_04150 [Thermodesulfobacteriota bacterium]